MNAIGGTSQVQSETSEVGHAYRPATATAGMSARGRGKDRAVTPEVGMIVAALTAKL